MNAFIVSSCEGINEIDKWDNSKIKIWQQFSRRRGGDGVKKIKTKGKNEILRFKIGIK
jgi:hypothetical protein